ncbi:MAG: nicotinamide mononucleotide transporter [Acidobacteria bacterium]|nr:nicotinamide mononucleotide transporter [Acidobacteriota bacterium]
MSWVEILGFVTGAASVWLAVKENVWNWPIAAANAVFFFILFFEHRLYGDMALQVIFFALAILGWYRWLRGGEHHTALHVSRITLPQVMAALLVTIAATAATTAYLRRVNDAAPFLDALTTVLSLVGQYLLTKKIIENWYVWIAADVLYIGLYIQRGLYLTSVLYVIFLLMCVAGAAEWQKTLRAAPATQGL